MNNFYSQSHIPCVMITGASRGFGRALTSAFHSEGWHIIPIVRNPSDVEIISEAFPVRCSPILADVSTITDSKHIIDTITATGGQLSLLVNNAGIPGHGATIDTIDVGNISSLIATHCIGALHLAKLCAPFLRQHPSGWIVNVSSRLGSLHRNALGEFDSEIHSYAYRIAKAALNMATLCLSHDKSLSGIGVIALHPGRMQTPLGGTDAPHTTSESAALFVQRFQKNEFQSGNFYDLYGSEIAW